MSTNACEGVECAYCLADVDGGLPVPSVTDDEAWAELAEQHRDDCEWVATRAHRVAAVPAAAPARGDTIAGLGVTGRYVGARNGVEWIAWEGEDFATVCEAFDAKGRP